MAASMLRKGCARPGVRPFNPYRDTRAVADLIALAFGDSLDPAGRAALADMRRGACWGALLGWFYHSDWGDMGLASGFVWIEEGRVVGNVSLRRALEWGGFLVGNVAVHPDWQGRGIASALMEATLDEISAQGGRWVGLEVEADNQTARRLYESEGFREIGGALHMLRLAGLPWDGKLPQHPSLRRGHGRDSSSLVNLVRAVVPEHQRPLLEWRLEDYRPGWGRAFDQFLEGRREAWWVIEDDGVICAAVRVLRERKRYPDRIEMLVSPKCSGRFEDVLVQRAVASLQGAPKKAVETLLPGATDALITALRMAGFQELRVLVQMRLDLV